MTLKAGFQQSVTFMQCALPGDKYTQPGFGVYDEQGFIVDPDSAGQKIGTFCWGVDGTNNQQITPFKGANTRIAGFVIRGQQSVWANASLSVGYSDIVPATQQLPVCANGSFYAVCPSLNGGGVIVAGDIIILNNLTGELKSQTTGVIPANYTQVPGYKVINAAPADSQTADMVIISNEIAF